jgi:hypothetical protein
MTAFFRSILACLMVAVAATPAPLSAAATADVIEKSGPIVYVTGGVGEEERAALKKIEKQFNLKLIFTLKEGAFIADVQVAISTPKGKPILADQAQGPIFMARLPAGTYVVEATFEGSAQQRKTTVGKGLQTLTFAWPGKPGVDTPIR